MASRILCISDGNKQQLSTLPLANQKNIVPVYNYVDFSSPTLSKIEHPRFPLNIAVIGRLQNKHKGQYDLIKNIACYIKTSDINILLFGDGPDHNLLKSAISRYSIENNVQILGHISTESIYKKHLFSVVLSYSLSERLLISTIFEYKSGNSLTIPESMYIIDGELLTEWGERNSYRMDPYHRMDIALTWKNKDVKKNGDLKKYKSEWVLSIYNLYNRQNPYFIYFETNMFCLLVF